jgi:Uma2 family endonuclease
MTTALRTGLFTADDYRQLPEGDRHQLIGGAYVLTPSPSTKHQWIVGELLLAFRANRLGLSFADLDVALDPHNVFRPDVVFVSSDRRSIVTEYGIEGAPDLVVEVLSPASTRYDREDKGRAYFAAGVREYWLVDPERETVEVLVASTRDFTLHRAYTRDDVLTTPSMPGLSIALGAVFHVG